MEAVNPTEQVFSFISSSGSRLTLQGVERFFIEAGLLERKAIRKAVRELINQGAVQYNNSLGCSFLEPSIQGIRRISPHIVLKNPRQSYSPGLDEAVVVLAQGCAFGMGDHPSTRLALKGIEIAVRFNPGLRRWKGSCLLDIGTGTGVLMIAAVLLGMGRAYGIDTDPCALYEAHENVRLNGVADRITVTGESIEALRGPYSLVTANLRWPTIKMLALRIRMLTKEGSAVVVSGVREQELEALLATYDRPPLFLNWIESDHGWFSALFIKRTGEA